MAFLNKEGLEHLWAQILMKLNGKVDKEEGKGLSTNDFTNEEKEKLATLCGGATEYNRINVCDYGAVGDGVANDQPAIWAAITAAKELIAQDISCELYFPAGTYGILQGGFCIALPRGKGGLRITGAGRETTTIKYLPEWWPDNTYGSAWYAIDVKPAGDGVTGDYDTYIHDVAITGLTVYDPDPCSHAIHPDKGDSDKEENHGVNIGWCLRASVTDCQFVTVGDEAIDIYSCNDAIVMNNHCVGSPGAGSAGGAISVCDGSVGVVVMGNTINGSALDETLDDGTVIQKGNFGIALESLYAPVRDVVVANNTIHNIQGNGINLGAINSGAGLYNITIEGNIIQGCNNGISDEGGRPKELVSIHNNIICNCVKLRDDMGGCGILFEFQGFVDASICGNKIRDTGSTGIYVQGVDTVIDENVIENAGGVAIYIINSATIRNCNIKKVTGAAVYCYGDAVYTVSGCRISDILSGTNSVGLFNPTEVVDTMISFVDADGNAVTSNKVINSDRLTRLVNCQLNGWMDINVTNTLVQGVTLNSGQTWQPAIRVLANNTIITGCHITAPNGREAIKEYDGCNCNMFTNNIVNRTITTVGANSLAINNINTNNTAYVHEMVTKEEFDRTIGSIDTALDDALDAIIEIQEDLIGVTLITFTIDGTEYKAKDGMTLIDWAESEYGSGTHAVSWDNGLEYPYVYRISDNFGVSDIQQSVPVNGNDVIVDGKAYYHVD